MDTRGSARTFQSLSGSLHSYLVWCASPNAFSDPDNATGVNIRITGNVRDLSQKNFEILIQSIGLRASPVILQEPVAVADLASEGSSLTGEGFVWCFGVERAQAFEKDSDPSALLKTEIKGIVLATGVTLDSTNIEFQAKETLC